MSATIIKEKDFPAIVEIYNAEGRRAAYDVIRSQYGVKTPYGVIRRIEKHPDYDYDKEQDSFRNRKQGAGDGAFLSLDELCGAALPHRTAEDPSDLKAQRIEKLIHELMSDRLLELGKYVVIDPSDRTIVIDRTSLTENGYTIVTH